MMTRSVDLGTNRKLSSKERAIYGCCGEIYAAQMMASRVQNFKEVSKMQNARGRISEMILRSDIPKISCNFSKKSLAIASLMSRLKA